MNPQYAKICWNEQDWKRPSGSAKDGPKTFFGKYGFGFEEWLFDPTAEIDGGQYGFLQPVNKGYSKRIGEVLWLRLYTVPGGAGARYREMFEISECQVLTPKAAAKAFGVFQKSGRLARMIQQVNDVGRDPSHLTDPRPYAPNIVNVRFRLRHLRKLAPNPASVRAAYYQLYDIAEDAFFLTWNPSQSNWDELQELVAQLASGERAKARWSCGRNQSIKPGQRVFMLRQGKDNPGLIGSGRVTHPSYSEPHWDKAKRANGQRAWYVKLEWDALVLPEEVCPRARLLSANVPHSILDTRVSGISISAEDAHRLEDIWSRHFAKPFRHGSNTSSTVSALEGEPIEHRGYRRKRDQRLVRLARDEANGRCAACEVDFSKVLNGLGLKTLQVHHTKQLGYRDTPVLTTLGDLVVVCANCHRLIHADPKKAIQVDKLKAMLGAAAKERPDE